MTGTVEGAEAWIARLEQAIRARRYDCDCQVGGVDAMSIDTDWLRQAVADIKVGWTNLRQAEAELARYKAFADEVMGMYVGSESGGPEYVGVYEIQAMLDRHLGDTATTNGGNGA